MNLKVSLLSLLFCGFIWSCSPPCPVGIPENIASNELEVFKIDNSTDTTLYTSDEIIIHLAANSIVDETGTPVDNYEMNFAGFMDASDALASNLTTTTDEGLINTSAIIYTSITNNGQSLFIDPESPISFDIPDYYDNEGIKIYKPKDSESDNIVWKESPEPTFLTTLDFNILDFLPKGFANSATETHGKALTPETIDSIYYALESYELREAIRILAYGAEHSEFLYMVKEDKNRKDSDIKQGADTVFTSTLTPAAIKVLKNPKFKNTFIATRAFEERLKTLHNAHCFSMSLLETYLQNLHEPMWVSDSIIFFQKKFDDPFLYDFEKFYKLRTTNTRKAPKSSSKLFEWFMQELWKERNQIRKEQEKSEKEVLNSIKNILSKREKFIKSKQKLLKKREAYRMKRFGFEMISTGWYNFAIPAKPEELEKFYLDVTVENGKLFQQTYVYVVNPRTFSLYALKSEDNTLFNSGYTTDKHLLMWNSQQAIITAIGREKGRYAYDKVDWKVEKANQLSLTLEELSFKELRKTLKRLPLKKRENKIMIELRIDEKLAKQDSLLLIEIEKTKVKQAALKYLFEKAYPCNFSGVRSKQSLID